MAFRNSAPSFAALQRLLLGLAALFVAGAAFAQVEVLDAWYGTPALQNRTIAGVTVAERIRKNTQNNVIVVPANMNAFFGADPVPNQAKGVVVTVRVQGQTANVAQNEGKELRYPGVVGRDYFVYVAPATAPSAAAAPVEILDAWYGTPAVQSKTVGGVSVIERVRKNMQNNVIVVPANMNTFFGGDPAPNQQKGVVITLRTQGQTASLAQIEGKEFRYPGVTPQDYYVYVAPASPPAPATTAQGQPPTPPVNTPASKPVPPTPVIVTAPPPVTPTPRSAVPPTPVIVAVAPPKSAEQLKFEADQQRLAREAADRAAAGKASEDLKAKAAAAAAAATKVNETNAAANINLELSSAFGILQAATDTNIGNLAGAPSNPSLLKTLTSTTPTAGGKPSIQTTAANQNAAQDVFEKKLDASRARLAALSSASGNSVVEGYYTRYEALTKRFADELDKAEAATDNLTMPVALQTPPSLICPTSNGAANAEFCWRDSATRGVGTVPIDCPAGTDRIGLFCYAQCKPGMKRVGFDCHSTCPAGWRDDGLFCRQAEYGRGVGYPWKGQDGLSNGGMMNRCEAAQGAGKCEMWGAISYPKCKEGWEPFGCCLCRPKTTPNCSAMGLGGGFDLSCGKKIEIGSPKVGRCPAGKEMDAGLCYRACPLGYDGVGPVCWANAPKGWSACGMGAINGGSADCAKKISSQVTAVVDAGIKIATAVATAGAPIGPANAARLAQLKEQFANLKKLKKAAAPVGLVVVVTNLDPDPGLPEFANLANNLEKKIDAIVTDEDIARLTMEIAAATLPSGGITGAIGATANLAAAYTYPKCSKYFQPGTCTPAPLPKTAEKKTQVQIALEEQAAATLKVERKLALQEQCKICTAPLAQLDLSTYCNSLDYCAKTCDLSPEYEVRLLNKGATAAEYCRAEKNLLDYPNCERIVSSYCPADAKSCAALINKSCGAPPAIMAVTVVDRAGAPPVPAGGWPSDCAATIDPKKPQDFYDQHKCMQLSVVSGDGQAGQGNTFADLKVRLRWRDGTPVPGYPVYFGCVPVVTPKDISNVPTRNNCQVNNDWQDDNIRKPILTGADGIATTKVSGQALQFGAPLRVVAEAGGLSGQLKGSQADVQFPGTRVDYVKFATYEWPPFLGGGVVGAGYSNAYVDQKTNASFITYFNLILLKR